MRRRLFSAKPPPEFTDQMKIAVSLNDLLSVLRPLVAQHLRADTAADLPIEENKSGVDRLGDLLPGLANERLDVVQKGGIRGNECRAVLP